MITLTISCQMRLDMCTNQIMPFLPVTLGAITGTLFMFLFSILIEHRMKVFSQVLAAIGRETYIVMAFSQIIIMTLNEWFSFNSLVKYAILTCMLILLVTIKNRINKIVGHRLL